MSDNRQNDNHKANERCAVCGRYESETQKLIRLPGSMAVCPECMQQMVDMTSSPEVRDMMSRIGSGDLSGLMGFEIKENRQDETPVNHESEEKSTEKEKTSSEQTAGSFFGIPLGNIFGFQNGPQVKQKEDDPSKIKSLEDLPAPHEIKARLDQYVIGQDQAKKVIAVAVYNHYKRVFADPQDDIEIEKSNILMIGPTGCGKTYLVKTLARILDVPLAVTDATSLTEAGYIGDDIESVISKLLAAADNNVERCQRGIVFIDEIDKIAKKANTNHRDVSGEAVQQGLLKLLEGAQVEVPVGAGSKNAMVPMTTVDTKNILFICGGAFPGMDEIIKERLRKQSSMGFGSALRDAYDHEPNLQLKTTAEDVRKFGMIPEFIGRLPILCCLEEVTDDMLVRILQEPQNAILRQYQKLMALDGVELVFDDDALEAIADRAKEKKTGARALRSVIEEFMLDIMFEIPKDKHIGSVRITRAYVEHRGGPVIGMKQSPLLLKN